jgi:hypothetical protein
MDGRFCDLLFLDLLSLSFLRLVKQEGLCSVDYNTLSGHIMLKLYNAYAGTCTHKILRESDK